MRFSPVCAWGKMMRVRVDLDFVQSLTCRMWCEVYHDSIHVRYLYTSGSIQLPNAKDNEGIVRYHIQKAIRSLANRSPPVTLVMHGGSDLAETSDVGTTDKGWELALGGGEVLLGGTQAVLEAVLHDALELLVDLLGGP